MSASISVGKPATVTAAKLTDLENVSTADGTQASVFPYVYEVRTVDEKGIFSQIERHLAFPASITYEAPGVYVGIVLALPGCATQGSTREETRDMLKSAIREVLDMHRRAGTKPTYVEPAGPVDPSSLANIYVDVENS